MSAVICYGSMLPDRVLHLPRFPVPGEGLHALGEALYVGGEPSNVGGHLATWGVPVVLAGNRLGDDPLGRFVLDRLTSRPHTRVLSKLDPAVQTPTCYILTTPDGERTLVPSWPTPTGWVLPDAATLQRARLVSASIYGPGMDEMLQQARMAGLPTAVSDVSGPDDSRVSGAAIVVTSRAVLAQHHGVSAIDDWIAGVHEATGALVVVSDGPRAVRLCGVDGARVTAIPPSVTPRDTTGAGDTLKAGLILGWLEGWPTARMLRFAVAAASLACLRPGACEQPAPIDEVDALARAVTIETN